MHRQAVSLFDGDDFLKQLSLGLAREVRPGRDDVLLTGPELVPELKQLVADRQPIKAGDSEATNQPEMTRNHLLKDHDPVIPATLNEAADLVPPAGNGR